MSNTPIGLANNRSFDPNIHFPVVIHGYEIMDKRTLGPLARAVCETAHPALMTHSKSVAILLGGWHLHNPGPQTTIADVMKEWLLEKGVQRNQIITQRSMGLCRFKPPRDTWEELVLLLHMMVQLDPDYQCDIRFVAWDFHMSRLMRMYKDFFPLRECVAFSAIPTPFPGLGRRKFMERIARFAQKIRPDGTHWLCRRIRAERTLEEKGIPLIP